MTEPEGLAEQLRDRPAKLGLLVLVVVTATAAAVEGLRFGDITGFWIVAVCGALATALAAFAVTRIGKEQVRRLEVLAMTDSLCGLPNRRALHQDVGVLRRRESQVAIAMIDLDGFKSVNDFYGHNVGDRVIKSVADLIAGIMADQGTAYRLGGDEFAIVMSGKLSGNIAEGLCRQLIDQLATPIMVDDRSIVLGASIGLAINAAGTEPNSSELLRQADVAMYASKTAGKRRVTWFRQEFDQDREAQQSIDIQLRQALAEDQLEVHYQPLIDSESGKVSAVEALIRWERPGAEPIGPDRFIPVAEETGLIEAVGLWVLRQACIDALDWGDTKLSVNVSAVQLRNPQFPLLMGQVLEETGFPSSRLELEFTETFLIDDQEAINRNLDMIRQFGVSIVLDDYGTGFASIGYLRRFRFEKLKLDRSLITDATADEATRAVMVSSIAIAKALGMRVTAEGIETETHAALARTAGCDQMQGWHFSKALPAEAIHSWMSGQDETTRGYKKNG